MVVDDGGADRRMIKTEAGGSQRALRRQSVSLCVKCGSDFGDATSVVCLHCGATLNESQKQPEPAYHSTKTRLSYDARRILELIGCVPANSPAPNAKAISSALGIDWGQTHRLVEKLEENGLIASIVSSEHGSQYSITPRGKTFL